MPQDVARVQNEKTCTFHFTQSEHLCKKCVKMNITAISEKSEKNMEKKGALL